MKNNNHFKWAILLTLVAMILTLVLAIMAFQKYSSAGKKEEDAQIYDQYYVMIVNDYDSAFWRAVYENAYAEGLENNVYVDLLGSNFSKKYTRYELMEIAIYSGVDGIIVEADDSITMKNLIVQAKEAGIPVVTLYSDNTNSMRISYVGVDNYEMGKEYGEQILALSKDKPKNVAVLMSSNSGESGQNIVWSGIQDTVLQGKKEDMAINLSILSINESNEFSVEESIRDIFMTEDIPDIIVCLNEVNTTCVYQAVVDYNKVGQIDILGYYDSDTILKGVFRSVITASIAVDTEQMGKYCVEALTEYYQLGNTNEYYVADITVIDKYNVKSYMGGKDEN